MFSAWRQGWRSARAAVLVSAAALGGGCSTAPAVPDLDRIYAQVARDSGPGQHPLITVPGILGSRLVDPGTGAVLWGGGGSAGLSADPDDPAEARLIALPVIGPDEPFDAIRDGVIADGILERARAEILGIPVVVDVYSGVLKVLAAGGFGADDRPVPATGRPAGAAPSYEDYQRIAADEANAFRFAYDWRSDLPSTARQFHRFVMNRKRHVAAIRSLYEGRVVEPAEVRLDLLAHSMGGLLTRYYLMHGTADLGEDGSLPPLTWAGAEHFRRVVFVAPPNAGSILAVENLVLGEQFGPLQPIYPPALLATHPAAWQLLPRARHDRLHVAGDPTAVLDPLDPAVWERFGWGLLDRSEEGARIRALLLPDLPDDAARLVRARAHQARLINRARRFQRAMDRWSPPPAHLETFLVVGGGFRTPAAAEVDPATGALSITQQEEGDGVVLRASALLDERQGRDMRGGLVSPLKFDTTLFLPDEHVGLTRNPVFGDNLLFWLLERPRDPEMLAPPEEAAIAATAPAPRRALPAPGAPDR